MGSPVKILCPNSILNRGPILWPKALKTQFTQDFLHHRNNNTISNYHLLTSGPISEIGMFGYINGTSTADRAIISNLNIDNSSVYSTNSGLSNIGIMIGRGDEFVRIKNVSIANSNIQLPGCAVTLECYNIGSLAGNFTPTTSANISEAYNIKINNFSFKADFSFTIGGAIGRLGNGASLRSSSLDGLNIASSGYTAFNIGGLVGEHFGEIYDVQANVNLSQTPTFLGAADVFQPKTTNTSIGGIAGSMAAGSNARLIFAKAEGVISLGTVQYVGGAVGSVLGGQNLDNIVSNVDILGNGDSVGGIAGVYSITSGTFSSSFIRNFGDLTCLQFCGGIFGYFTDLGATSNVFNAHNYGDIVATGANIGGFAGKYQSQTTSLAKVIHNEGNITGDTIVGGIIGNRFTSATNGRSKIELAYNIATIH